MAKQTFTTGQVLTAAQQNSLQANDFNQTVSVKTANYSLLAADKGTRIEFNTSGSVTCTVNSGEFDAGDTLVIQNRGAGAATVTAGTATVNTSASLVVKQYDSGVLYFVSDSSAIYFASDAADTPLTTKGDLFTFSTAADRLAVGSNGETLVADSSATTGLRWQGNFAAGKNKIINGDFRINQRQFTTLTSDGYGFDRWAYSLSGATATYSAETFTLGTAPVQGYEGTNFARITTTTGNDFCRIGTAIESVRTFAGETVTLSFWAKGTNPTTAGNLATRLQQVFGSGGSTSVSLTEQTFVLTANWTRYSFTFAVPSISGKTIGTNDFLKVDIGQISSISSDSWTLDLWGVQLEAGSVATPFQTATGTLAGELAACQRYYIRLGGNVAYETLGVSYNVSTTAMKAIIALPVSMRVNPTSIESSTLCVQDTNDAISATLTSVVLADAGRQQVRIAATGTGLNDNSVGTLLTNNSTSGYIAFSAEL